MANRYYKGRTSDASDLVFDYYGTYEEEDLLRKFGSEQFKKLYVPPTERGGEWKVPSDADKQAELRRILREERLIAEQDRPQRIGRTSPLMINEDGHLVPRPEEELKAAREALEKAKEEGEDRLKQADLRRRYQAIDRRIQNKIYATPFKYDGKHFPCLLYTSPSPRDRTRSRMPSSA